MILVSSSSMRMDSRLRGYLRVLPILGTYTQQKTWSLSVVVPRIEAVALPII